MVEDSGELEVVEMTARITIEEAMNSAPARLVLSAAHDPSTRHCQSIPLTSICELCWEFRAVRDYLFHHQQSDTCYDRDYRSA